MAVYSLFFSLALLGAVLHGVRSQPNAACTSLLSGLGSTLSQDEDCRAFNSRIFQSQMCVQNAMLQGRSIEEQEAECSVHCPATEVTQACTESITPFFEDLRDAGCYCGIELAGPATDRYHCPQRTVDVDLQEACDGPRSSVKPASTNVACGLARDSLLDTFTASSTCSAVMEMALDADEEAQCPQEQAILACVEDLIILNTERQQFCSGCDLRELVGTALAQQLALMDGAAAAPAAAQEEAQESSTKEPTLTSSRHLLQEYSVCQESLRAAFAVHMCPTQPPTNSPSLGDDETSSTPAPAPATLLAALAAVLAAALLL